MNSTLKRILNATWKVGLGLFGLAALVICILITSVWYENSYGRACWKDKTLSKDIQVHGYNNNCVRVWDCRTASYITSKLLWVSGTPLRDSITVYSDTKGNRGITPATFTNFEMISKELIKAELSYNYDEAVVMDKNGRVVNRSK